MYCKHCISDPAYTLSVNRNVTKNRNRVQTGLRQRLSGCFLDSLHVCNGPIGCRPLYGVMENKFLGEVGRNSGESEDRGFMLAFYSAKVDWFAVWEVVASKYFKMRFLVVALSYRSGVMLAPCKLHVSEM
jgi:hypothetical protein